VTQGGDSGATWLPNLVGGVSIWKLAVDLNEPKFFDGRLLVPETEGSESLPITVRWDLAGLVPLREAQAQHPAETATALADFKAALERVAKVFATPASGFDKYKQAFTVPAVDADGGANYFYSPTSKKVFVINWGASPRSMAGKAEYVFGYEDWGKVMRDRSAPVAGAALAGAALGAAAAPAAAAAAAAPDEKDDKAEKAEKKDDGKKRPWWIWPLFALIAIALVLLALFLLRACEEPGKLGPDGGDATAEAATDGAADALAADAHDEAGDAAGAGDGGDAGDAAAHADAGDGGDAGAHADAGDAGKDGGKDGGLAQDDDDDDDDPTSGGAGGSGGGKVVVTLGGAGGGNGPAAKTGPHRRHYQAEATKWRIAAGNDRVARTEQRGKRFDVWLAPGRTFQGVGVEWQDGTGKWHTH